METMFNKFVNNENVIILGDFNFDNDKEQNKINNNYKDIWQVLNKNIDGFTMKKIKYWPAWRPDKILIK